MCYPKPGPRCSAHAAATFAKAHQAVLSAFMDNRKDPELEKLIAVRRKAEAEYKLTPAYLKSLERQIKKNPTQEWHAEEYETLSQERSRRLAAVADRKVITHRKAPKAAYTSPTFFKTGDTLEEMHYKHADLLNSMADSQNWSAKLDDTEIATLRWYSEDGYADINGHLSASKNPYAKNVAPETLDAAVTILDDAFAKHEPAEEGVMVYRRHHLYDEKGYHSSDDAQNLDKHFPVGSTYEPKFFMSTSLNPQDLPSKDNINVSLQILTKSGAPITAISSQGPREYEFIIPRGAKFEVVANDVKVKKVNKKGEAVELTIVQLREI